MRSKADLDSLALSRHVSSINSAESLASLILLVNVLFKMSLNVTRTFVTAAATRLDLIRTASSDVACLLRRWLSDNKPLLELHLCISVETLHISFD